LAFQIELIGFDMLFNLNNKKSDVRSNKNGEGKISGSISNMTDRPENFL